MPHFKKTVYLATFFSCLGFVFLSIYFYILERISIQQFACVLIFFGVCAIAMIFSLTTRHKDWFLENKNLDKRQKKILAICGIVIGICFFWITQISSVNIVFKSTLLLGSIFFSIGGIILLLKS